MKKREDIHTISVDKSIWRQAKEKAEAQGRYLSGVIKALLLKWIRGEVDLND